MAIQPTEKVYTPYDFRLEEAYVKTYVIPLDNDNYIELYYKEDREQYPRGFLHYRLNGTGDWTSFANCWHGESPDPETPY